MPHVDPLKTRLNWNKYSFWSFQYTKGLVFTVKCDESFCFSNHWINRRKHADTLGAAPPQWVFYPLNFLMLLQLATCLSSYQVGICIMHTHTPTTPNITFIFSIGTVPFSLALSNTQTHAHSSRKAYTREKIQACIQMHSQAHRGNVTLLNVFVRIVA